MPHRSSTPHETVSDEIKLLNYSNYQQQLTGQNIYDIASDIMLLRQKAQTEKENIALLESKIDHLLAGQEEVKSAIILASEKLEKRLDVLGKMMGRTQNVSNKNNRVIQTALDLIAKGHKAKHERRYSFGMMSIQEDDQRPEFLFGQEMEDQAELNELKDMVSQFKWIPNAISDKYLSAFRIPKREDVGSSNPTNQGHNHPQITGPPPPFDT